MDKKILEIVKKSLDKWPKALEKELDFLKAFEGMVELNQELIKAKVEKSLDLVVGLAEKAYGEQTQAILAKSNGVQALVSYREESEELQAELEKSWEKKTEIDFSEYDESELEKGRGKDKQPRKKRQMGSMDSKTGEYNLGPSELNRVHNDTQKERKKKIKQLRADGVHGLADKLQKVHDSAERKVQPYNSSLEAMVDKKKDQQKFQQKKD